MLGKRFTLLNSKFNLSVYITGTPSIMRDGDRGLWIGRGAHEVGPTPEMDGQQTASSGTGCYSEVPVMLLERDQHQPTPTRTDIGMLTPAESRVRGS